MVKIIILDHIITPAGLNGRTIGKTESRIGYAGIAARFYFGHIWFLTRGAQHALARTWIIKIALIDF